MAYRDDPDLEFLRKCQDEDLEPLVGILLQDGNGKGRWTEGLSSYPGYKKFAPKHSVYWHRIAEEIQRFGANSIATMLRRGEGVPYREILVDVCRRLKVDRSDDGATPEIEQRLLLKLLTDAFEKMSPEELRDFAEGVGVNPLNLTGPAIAAAIQAALKAGAFKTFQLAAIVANGVAKTVAGRGLTVAANAGLMRSIGIAAGPVGWAATGLWTAVELAGPAYRVTVPATIMVAYLRAKKREPEA